MCFFNKKTLMIKSFYVNEIFFCVKSKFYYITCKNCLKCQVFRSFLFITPFHFSQNFWNSRFFQDSRFIGNPVYNLTENFTKIQVKIESLYKLLDRFKFLIQKKKKTINEGSFLIKIFKNHQRKYKLLTMNSIRHIMT